MVMRKSVLSCAVILAAAAWSGSSYATNVGFADTYSTTYNTSDPGLVLQINNPTGSNAFVLDSAGGSTSQLLFKVSSSETTANADDLVGKDITVDFAFTSPSIANGTVMGTSVGGHFKWSLDQGYITWDQPTDIVFAGVGTLQIALSDTQFTLPLFGSFLQTWGKVNATFTLTPYVAAVPIPPALALFGGGLVGTGLLARRRKQKQNLPLA